MTANKKVTSPQVASKASDILRDKNSSATAKSLAASALSQVQRSHQTGKDMEAQASAVLKSDKYSAESKAIAASLVSQSNKAR
ncbi:hypothetical protein [Rugamonas rivuli]|uniref:Uncharacterized protein n=1 Tax=Rugamonas rivuli TaxID=2743358 RepID=A0A843SU11_9BURK|nr:hypothetical protein [Rugamonas rivuli]MQA23646.1 hypothetical protein [Rugamonas rivuli]